MSEPDTVPHTHGGNPLKALTRKIGPFQGWVYVLLAVAVWYVYRWWKNRSGGGATVTPITADQSGLGSSVDGGSGSGSISTGVPPSNPVSTNPSTNATWKTAAIAFLIQHGRTPLNATNAIDHYLSKQALTDNQWAMVNEAIAGIGAPPNPVQAIHIAPAPVATIYVTQRGDTLQHLASHFYGHQAAWDVIKNANPSLSKYGATSLIKPGLRITIPHMANRIA